MAHVKETAALVVLALLAKVSPLFRLPAPAGPFAVGTENLPLGGETPLTLQVWYPAAPTVGGKMAPYQPDLGGLRNWLFRRVRTGAVLDAPIAADGTFPVLIYVNGWRGPRWENTAMLQDLASHGFVVAASDQPSGMLDGVDLDGEMDFETDDATAKTLHLVDVKLHAQVRTASLALDRLLGLHEDPRSKFAGRLDPAWAGVLGFSFGGATAAEAAVLDRRFRASLNMDGLTFGEVVKSGPPFPFMMMNDDTPIEDAGTPRLVEVWQADDRRVRDNLARNGGYYLTVAGSRHFNFCDYPIVMPWRRINGAGPVGTARAGHIVRYWVCRFFISALRTGEPLAPAADREITLEVFPPPSKGPGRDAAAPASAAGAPR